MRDISSDSRDRPTGPFPGSVPQNARRRVFLMAQFLAAALFVALGVWSVWRVSAVDGAPDWAAGRVSARGAALLGGAALLALMLWPRLVRWRRERRQNTALEVMDRDNLPAFLSDRDGRNLRPNLAAQARLVQAGGLDADDQALAQLLRGSFADPEGALERLRHLAGFGRVVAEEVSGPGGHMRLTVQPLHRTGLIWRIEDLQPRQPAPDDPGPDAIPQLTLGPDGRVLGQNPALTALIGKTLDHPAQLFQDTPPHHGDEQVIQTADGPQRRLVLQRVLPDGRSEIYLFAPRGSAPATDPTSFEALPVALLRMDRGGRILLANRAARALVGPVRRGEILADLLEGLGRPVTDWTHEVSRGQGEGRPEVLRVRRADREIYLQVTLSRLTQGGQSGLVAVMSDATALKSLEAQFVQSQKMQAIGQLAGGIAHDFNNLLTAISGHCDLLMLRCDPVDPDYSDLNQISQNANRAAALVGQLLAYSRKQTLKPRVIHLRDTLSELTHLLNRLVGEKVTLTLRHDENLPPLRADKRQLEQVIMNLVVNARDAMPDGGTIRLETERLSLSDGLSRDRATLPPGDYVVIRVIDQGVGIALDKQDKIFEPFYTTKRTGEGTGLGLSTAYGIVKQTGGFIFCDSTPGQGTCFSLFFPPYDGEEELAPRREAAPTPLRKLHKQTGAVLLVEDEAPVRAFAARALRMKNLTVYEAEDAEEALEILSDAELHVDVFVSDVVMPGLDGPSWVKEALKARPDTPVIFMSGYAEDIFEDGRPEIPDASFLPKPFSLGDLTKTVREKLTE